ncbi:lipoprotein [Spiroplasma culicicola]|uniref:Lipoprotein n=1 Tax=Spiroplasma culicicola AES-1 TaxID=1276246 RepID=W6A837_9MOLU|nr:lipoprotein [Spiroplasma culicicola]AHI53152.1 hypothetical protein SCULI_v1c08120 [Spiroplasma culicicola AES-1]
MKKLLSLLGSVSLLTTAGNAVVACTNDRITSPKLDPDLAKQIIAKLAGTDVASIDFGDLFSSADVTTVVVNIINDLISKQYSYDSTNKLLSQLGLNQYAKPGESNLLPEDFLNFFNQNASTIAEDILFTEYTKSISSGIRMDFTQANSLYALNPIRETTVKSFDGESDIKVNIQDKIWFNGKIWAKGSESVDGNKELPKLEDLTEEYASKKAIFKIGATESSANEITAKTALKLRFQDYFENKLMKDIISNLLTTSFIEANMFNISSQAGENSNKNGAYLNISNTLFSKTQSWNTSSTADWKTNVKMVWSYKIDNTDQKAAAQIKTAFNALNSFIDTSTGELKDDTSLFKLMEDFKTNLGSETPIYNGDGSNAYDSFFGKEGFKGITIYENGVSIGTSPIANKAYEDAVKTSTKAGILLNSNTLPFFNDTDNSNIAEVVFVLPIYMIELLGASIGSENDVYKINGAPSSTIDEEENSVAINFGPTSQSSTRYSDVWNNLNNMKYHSTDVRTIASNEANRQAMINQIKYVVSQDTSVSDLAKTVLYSQYLDVDEIYYAGLFDQIGRYIKSDEDEDD